MSASFKAEQDIMDRASKQPSSLVPIGPVSDPFAVAGASPRCGNSSTWPAAPYETEPQRYLFCAGLPLVAPSATGLYELSYHLKLLCILFQGPGSSAARGRRQASTGPLYLAEQLHSLDSGTWTTRTSPSPISSHIAARNT
ncbi:hypothetical protein LIA77_07590 [Sarocladium implicatum]|nr:hypothetical protein LIA77_07590 [Sarocladium implicatum]